MDLYLQTPEDGYHFKANGIKMIEEKYGAKYMGYWCTKSLNDNWNATPVDVFYQPNPDTSKGHTHYFGMYMQKWPDDPHPRMYITDASTAFSEPITGGICEDGEVIVSRYRHDYVDKKGAMIDGGRDYARTNGCKLAEVTLSDDKFIIKTLHD